MERLATVRAIAEHLMAQHGLTDGPDKWTFNYNTRKRCTGLCRYRERSIEVSTYHAEQSPIENVTNTILHEIAHALTPGDNHGAAWRVACCEIGAAPARCYQGPEIDKQHKWELRCYNCGLVHKCYRKPKRSSSCARCCPGRFDKGFTLTLVEVSAKEKQ